MKLSESTHPLAIWLEREGKGVHEFAQESALPTTTLYGMLNGRDPRLTTSVKIEYATCGEVSVRQLADWHSINGEKNE